MRKWIPTILAVVVLLVGWMYAASQSYFREEAAEQVKLLGIQAGDIQAITIHKPAAEENSTASQESSQLKLEQGVWQMVEPKAYPLNGYAVSNLLDALSAADQELVVEESPTNVEKYGLGTDAARLDIQLKDQRKIELIIGGQLPADDARYVRVDSGAVVAVKSETISGIELSRRELLDTTPFNLDESNVQSLDWEAEASTWILKSTAQQDTAEKQWTFNGAELEATDAVSLIGKIKNITTADDVRPASELKNTVPRFTFIAEQNVNGQMISDVYRGLTVASDPDQIWVITPDGEWAYALQADALKDVEDSAEALKK
ncbi:DUF4340 domain-containing protein [Paenibacillus sp. ACRSA]|uniref:DUF4340 domain-containing protein n=1 Tax=Paenibacillus sp. ACRSA TaxID=2918211 RepID=UPI001EF6D6D2|nr:DUF4340 domain-containing protein [Paenibacillus sp. ACRSA]MCG7380504.1 DUF4340 domain-containing protein [Paenibacillus sp. ACRSA]